MNPSIVRSALLGASVLMVHLPGHADATASADMTNVTIRLIDLDPSDGITPWVMFPAGPILDFDGGNLPTAEADAYSPTMQDAKAQSSTLPFGTASSSAAVPGATAFASYAGDPQNGGANFHSTASASGGSFENVFRAVADDAMTYGNGPGDFMLSPETELVMTAAATVQAATTTIEGDGQQDLGSAAAALQLSGTSPEQPLDNDFIAVLADPFDSLPGSVSNSAQLTVSFSNTGSSSEEGYYFAYVSLDARSGTLPPPPPPVPEPATFGLLFGGLGVIAWWRRRLDGFATDRKIPARRAQRY